MRGRVLLFSAVLALCACNRLTEVGENDPPQSSDSNVTNPGNDPASDGNDGGSDKTDGGTEIVDAGEPPPCGWQVASGPEGAQVRSMFVASDGLVLVGSLRGIYLSEDHGATWKRPATAAPPDSAVNGFAELGGDLYASFNNAGVWVSEDRGQTWTERNEGLINPITFNVVATGSDVFALSQTNSGPMLYRWSENDQKWYPVESAGAFSLIAATNETLIGAVSYLGETQMSTNGGQSWTVSDSGDMGLEQMIVAGSRIVGVPFSGSAPYISTDDGYTWTLLPAPAQVNSLSSPLAATDHEGQLVVSWPEGVFAWNGQTWTKLGVNTPTGYYGEVKVLVSNGAKLFGGSYADGVYTLSSPTAAWTLSSTGLSSAAVRGLAADDSLVFATADARLHVSRDHGSTWSRSNEGLPAEAGVSAVAVQDGVAYIGTYQHGVYKSANGGQSWTRASETFPNQTGSGGGPSIPVAAIGVKGSTVLVGADWGQNGSMGVLRSQDGGATWAQANGGRTPMGYDTLGNPTYSAAEFIGFVGGHWFMSTATEGLFRSTDDGKTWARVVSGLPYSAEYGYGTINEMVEAKGAIFAVGYIWNGTHAEPILARSTNGGQSWTRLQNGFPQDQAARAATVIGDSVYVASGGGSQNGDVYRSDDAGASWTKVDGLPVKGAPEHLAASGTRLVVGGVVTGVVTLETGVCTP